MGNVETLESYEQVSELGKGSFGSVTKVRNKKTGVLYALKRIYTERNPKTADKEKEIASYKKLKSPFLVEYFGVYEDSKNVYFLMEYCDGGDLEHLQESRKSSGQPMTEHEILRILFQCLMGLNGLHSNNFIHRDIKAANVYFAGDGNIRIGDFGTAKQLDSINSLSNTYVGTMSNMPPEVISRVPYTSKCDIYSLGVMVYELMTFKNPFNKNVQSILKGAYEKIENPLFSDALKELVYSMISLDPKDRPTCEELLQHPLMQHQQSLYNAKQIKEVSTAASGGDGSGSDNSGTSSVGGVGGGGVSGISGPIVSGDGVAVVTNRIRSTRSDYDSGPRVGNFSFSRIGSLGGANFGRGGNRSAFLGPAGSRATISHFDGAISAFAGVDSTATATTTVRASTAFAVTPSQSPPPSAGAADAHTPTPLSRLAGYAPFSPPTSSFSSFSSSPPLSSVSSSLSSSGSSSSSVSHSAPPIPPPPLLQDE